MCKYFECMLDCKSRYYCASCKSHNACNSCIHNGLCIIQPVIGNIIEKKDVDKSKN